MTVIKVLKCRINLILTVLEIYSNNSAIVLGAEIAFKVTIIIWAAILIIVSHNLVLTIIVITI